MVNKFTPIAAFTSAADATIARGLLEANGVACKTQEEKLRPDAPYYKGLGGKWQVQVPRKKLLLALRILKDKGRLRSEDFCAARRDILLAKLWPW